MSFTLDSYKGTHLEPTHLKVSLKPPGKPVAYNYGLLSMTKGYFGVQLPSVSGYLASAFQVVF